jgi:uncharacterized membrane protein YdbT with pleckstrin-like domain
MFTEGVYYRFGSKTFTATLLGFLPFCIVGIIGLILFSYLPQGVTAILGVTRSMPLLPTVEKIAHFIDLYGSIVLALIFLGLLIDAWLDYSSREFMLDHYALRVRTGFLSRREVAIPYDQIQNVNLNESVAGRMYGVSELLVLTAGHEDQGEESSGIFKTIDRSLALSLQDELLKRSSVQEIRTATHG